MGPSADAFQFSRDEGAAADNAVSIYTHSTHIPLGYDLIVVECDVFLNILTMLPSLTCFQQN